jgi:hypothetical protein
MDEGIDQPRLYNDITSDIENINMDKVDYELPTGVEIKVGGHECKIAFQD